MKVASHQPAFLPWPGFWHKFLHADVFVLSAGVGWSKDGFLNRIRHGGGWLTVPVTVGDTDPLCTASVANDTKLLKKMSKTVAQVMASPKRYPHRDRIEWLPYMIDQYQPGKLLYKLNTEMIMFVARSLQAKTKVVLDATPKEIGETKVDRLKTRLQRCSPGVSMYLMGAGGASYYDPGDFEVPVQIQDPTGFDPELSIIDVLATEPDPVDYVMTNGSWHGG